MIVYQFHIRWPILRPPETQTPLPVDADAVLPAAITLESFKLIIGRHTQVNNLRSSIKHPQFSLHHIQKILWQFA
jgi:hypothetical protein